MAMVKEDFYYFEDIQEILGKSKKFCLATMITVNKLKIKVEKGGKKSQPKELKFSNAGPKFLADKRNSHSKTFSYLSENKKFNVQIHVEKGFVYEQTDSKSGT